MIKKKCGLKVDSTTFFLLCFLSPKDNFCETRKNAFYFTSKALLVKNFASNAWA